MNTVATMSAVVLALAVTSVTSGTAHAAPPGALDHACGFTSFSDPRMAGRQLAEIEGGPILQNGTLTCTIKVNAATHAAVATESASASADGVGAVTYLHPQLVTYTPPENANLYLCSEFTDAGGTTYYYNAVLDTWSTDPNVPCGWAVSPG